MSSEDLVVRVSLRTGEPLTAAPPSAVRALDLVAALVSTLWGGHMAAVSGASVQGSEGLWARTGRSEEGEGVVRAIALGSEQPNGERRAECGLRLGV